MPCGPSARQQRRQRTDFRAGLQLARRARSVVQHLAAELVAEHDVAGKIHRLAAGKVLGQLDHAVRMLARMQVGAADAAGQRLDQHLPGARFGLRQRVDDDLAVPENGSAHRRPPGVFVSLHQSARSAHVGSEAITTAYRATARTRRTVSGFEHAGRAESGVRRRLARQRPEAASAGRARDGRCRGPRRR